MENAANLVVARGQFMQQFSVQGAMFALNCFQAETEQYIRESNLPVYLTAINSRKNCVVGGTVENVDQFEKYLGNSILAKRLKTNRAFHTPMIEPAIIHLKEFVTSLSLRELQIPMAVNVDGKIIEQGEKLQNNYFIEQARQPVRFMDSITSLQNTFSDAIYVEIGPSKTLTSIVKSLKLSAISFSKSDISNGTAILHGLGTFWAMGYPIKIDKLYNASRPIRLPTYPFFGPKFISLEAIAGTQYHLSNDRGSTNTGKSKKTDVLGIEAIDYKNNIKEILTKIWVELLSYEFVDSESDFFDLGGDSLLMVALINKVENTFSTKISPRSIIAARTLGKQVDVIYQSLLITQ